MKNIRTFDFNLLKALDVLLQEQNVTRAAERLAVTQPAMSAMLNRLRESFDDPLFIRTQHGIIPTARAQAIAPIVRQIMLRMDTILRPAEFDPHTSDMTLRIASTDYGLQAIVTPFLVRLKQHAPHIKVAFFPVQDVNLAAQFEQGLLDIALITTGREPPHTYTQHLFDEHYVCVMSEQHPAAVQMLDLNRFCELEFTMMSYDGGQFSGVADEALAKLGKSRQVTLSVNNFLLLPNILRKTNWVALLPSRLTDGLTGLVCKPVPLDVRGFSMQMVWHERTHQDSAHEWIRNLLVNEAK